MKINNLLNGLGFLLIILVFMTAGFYFGYRVRDNQATSPEAVAAGKGLETKATSKSSIPILLTEGVSWIKSGQSPVCPSTHPIKGTFQSDGGTFYTADNKSYDRVKPDICFATLEFARDNAGFVQKF